MILLVTIGSLVFMFWSLGRRQHQDTDAVEINAKQSRQDLRLISYLLVFVVVLLAAIVDKLPGRFGF